MAVWQKREPGWEAMQRLADRREIEQARKATLEMILAGAVAALVAATLMLGLAIAG